MAKKSFNPFVLLTLPDPEPTTVIGGGTGQSTPDIFACDYNDWLVLFAVDYDENGFDRNDYRQWFINNFGDEAADLWALYNDDPLYPVEPIIEPIIDPFPEP